ncbi:MAG: TIGR04100 family radical SAM protein [Lachnospiraceae bacterium]|nr:TIGR04100 family radical SAM protein [Lachnospiraceae bacterium]MDE6697882.1 TIGR04100 family radical SAM protein [Lachnospiraceae bacterium]
MTILYEYHNNLYINLTNRCSSACVFCLRQTREEMDGSGSLWLEHEPSYEEVIAEFSRFDMSKYKEVIFCGFGEPTERIDVLLQVAKYVKDNFGSKIRLNTNGQGNLINERDIVPELEGLIDCISISLNNPDPVKYQEIVRSVFGEKSFDAMIDFANEAKKYVPEVILSTVDTTISKEEEAKCKEICDSIGVTYRIREFEN